MPEGGVKVWFKIRKDDRSVSLKDVFEKMEQIRAEHPELDVYFDGDEFAICSRPLAAPPDLHPEHHHHKDKKKGRQVKLYSA
jgi:hypothetical protein